MTAQAEEKRATGFEAWSHDRARHFEWAAESMMQQKKNSSEMHLI